MRNLRYVMRLSKRILVLSVEKDSSLIITFHNERANEDNSAFIVLSLTVANSEISREKQCYLQKLESLKFQTIFLKRCEMAVCAFVFLSMK